MISPARSELNNVVRHRDVSPRKTDRGLSDRIRINSFLCEGKPFATTGYPRQSSRNRIPRDYPALGVSSIARKLIAATRDARIFRRLFPRNSFGRVEEKVGTLRGALPWRLAPRAGKRQSAGRSEKSSNHAAFLCDRWLAHEFHSVRDESIISTYRYA